MAARDDSGAAQLPGCNLPAPPPPSVWDRPDPWEPRPGPGRAADRQAEAGLEPEAG